MKILHVITSMLTGGAEHLLVDLLPHLRQLGCEVELALHDGTPTPFSREVEAAGIKVHSLCAGANVYSPRNAVRLAQVLRQGNYDVVHTHNTACQLFAPVARRLSGTRPVLVTTEHSANNRRRSIKALRPVDKWMYGQYQGIICISDQTQVNLEQYIGHRPEICTIYNGVDTSRFVAPIKEVAPEAQHTVIMVASLSAAKDQDTLVRAMAELPEGYRLQLAGDGPRRPAIEALARELGVTGRVELLGVRTDVSALLHQADVVVLSSHWEGLSLSSIEGMASGRPFVASDVDGLHEMVAGHGVLVPEGDYRAMAAEIADLCTHPNRYRQVAEACQRKALQYDITLMARNYHALYQKLLTHR